MFVCAQVRERALKEAEGIAKEVDTVAQGLSLVLLSWLEEHCSVHSVSYRILVLGI